MKLKAQIAHQCEISLSLSEDGSTEAHCFGSYHLLKKIKQYRKDYGDHPKEWPEVVVKDNEDILINEIVQKSKNNYALSYQHDELCHCRMVPTEIVLQSIKQGCRSVREISRVSKAGTGCGSCIPHIQQMLVDVLKKNG